MPGIGQAPGYRAGAAWTAPTPVTNRGRPGRRQVLIVDDDRQTREALTDLLDALGYSSASAADGRDALGYLERHDLPDLILMDLRMPEMSGWNFRIQLQRSPMLCRIPVVVFSATPALEAQARALKVNDHLRKPLDPERLIDLLRRYCHAPGPAAWQ